MRFQSRTHLPRTARERALFPSAVGLLSLGFVCWILFPTEQPKSASFGASCISNMRQIATAELLYTTDYDDRFSSATHWIEESEPYTHSTESQGDYHIYTCPAVQSPNQYGYAMADGMSRALVPKIKHQESTVLIFETPVLKADAHFPAAAPVVPFRHNGARVFAYVDGHVKTEHLPKG